jgi:hypothetical protein
LQVVVEIRLTSHQLQRDAHSILLVLQRHPRLALLLVRHACTQTRDLARITNALVHEPAVDRQHRDQHDEQN